MGFSLDIGDGGLGFRWHFHWFLE